MLWKRTRPWRKAQFLSCETRIRAAHVCQLGLMAHPQVTAHCTHYNTQHHVSSSHDRPLSSHPSTVGDADGVKTWRQFPLALCFFDSPTQEGSVCSVALCVLVYVMSWREASLSPEGGTCLSWWLLLQSCLIVARFYLCAFSSGAPCFSVSLLLSQRTYVLHKYVTLLHSVTDVMFCNVLISINKSF